MIEKVESIENTQSSKLNLLKLILGTGFGILFFIVPFTYHGDMTIMYSLLSKKTIKFIGVVPAIVTLVTVLSALAAMFYTYIKKDEENEFLKELFVVTPLTMVSRICAATIVVCVYFNLGHEAIYNEYTGGLIVNELIPDLYALFFFAFIFIPFLLEYGGMELFGLFFKPILKPLFKLPGITSVLLLGSWIGSGTVGILSIDSEYSDGHITAKEACTLIFGFCTISLPVTFIYSTAIAGLDVAVFPAFYLTLLFCGVVSSMIISRIPPISKKSMEFINGEIRIEEESEEEGVVPTMGLKAAIARVGIAPNFPTMIKHGCKKSIFMYVEAFPIIIFIATVALVATEYTPIFDIIAKPITPMLAAIGLPEAAQAAPNFIVGFADLLLPYLGATAITSQLTKFVICVVATLQIICMSETGALVLKGTTPISILDLAIVVLQKTIIIIPIALIIGRFIGLT